MSVLAELLGVEEAEEKPSGNLVLLRTRDGFEKRMAVEDHVVDYGELKVPYPVSDLSLRAGDRSMTANVTYTFRRFYRTEAEEDGFQVWEEA